MLKIKKIDNSIVIEGINNNLYPDNGTVTFPLNSIVALVDKSNIVTFKSASNGDVLFSAKVEDITINDASVSKENVLTQFNTISNVPMGGGNVDDALNLNSENAVQNKVITEALNTKATSEELTNAISGVEAKIPDVSNKQDTLVNQVNIKSINGQTLLGEGNIDIQGGGGGSVTVDAELSETSENPVQNKVITNALNVKVGSIILTQQEYDTLQVKDPSIMYVISDADDSSDNVFDATELFTASQKPQDKIVSEAFQTAILAAISEKKVMVIHNTDVNVVITFAQKKDSVVMFTATNNMQHYFIQLNTATREVAIEQKAVGTGTFDEYRNDSTHSMFELAPESTNNDIQVAFSTRENGVKVPAVGDVINVVEADGNIKDSGIVISHIKTADQIDLIIHSNNLVDDFEVSHHIKLNYNEAQGFDSLRIEKVTHNVINPASITDDKISALAEKNWVTEQINAAIAQVNEKINEINNKII